MEVINPTNKDIGRKVVYRPHPDQQFTAHWDYGVISSFNGSFVFVRYGMNTTAQATLRADLYWDVS